MEALIEKLYANDARELHRMVKKIVSSFGGISQKDMDDFYSVANSTIAEIKGNIDNKIIDAEATGEDSKNHYNPSKGRIEPYVYRAIEYRIKDFISGKNTLKRSPHDTEGNVMQIMSLDSPMGEDNASTVGEFLCSKSSDFDIIDAIESKNGTVWSENVEKYLNSLTKMQRGILMMKINGNTNEQIRDEYHLSRKRFEAEWQIIRSYEHTKHLYMEKTPINQEETREEDTMAQTTTSEKTKDTHFSVESIRKKLKKRIWREDHPLQRAASQWTLLFKSELLSDIMQGKALTQVIVSEEIKNGITMYWLIDGKQRCTNIDEFCRDGFAISKNVQVYMIKYQTQKRDENGELMFNEEGFPIFECKEFDIRRKKFSQLPEELQDKILEYQIPVLLNLNCTKKEIAYDIARFNRCRPMNVAQNGWTSMEEGYAEFVDKILDMDFFKTDYVGSDYKPSSNKSGTLRRIIVESIMAINFVDNLNRDFRKSCEFLTDEANDATFIDFYDLVERLMEVANEETAKVFTVKNSFLWFAVFDKCQKHNITDEQFVEFVTAFNQSLHNKEFNGLVYDDLDKKTKSNVAVVERINLLESMMLAYFDKEQEQTLTEFDMDTNWNEYVDKFSKSDLMLTTNISKTDEVRLAAQSVMLTGGQTSLDDTSIQEYIENNMIDDDEVESISFYMDMLNDYSLELDSEYKVYPSSIPTLVGVMKYAVDNEVADDVMVGLLKKWTNNLSSIRGEDKVHNYLMMVDDLKNEIEVA